jgi:DNA-binding response OmpR family regulator
MRIVSYFYCACHPEKMPKIFVIDDEKDFLITVTAWAEKKGYDITAFESADGCLENILAVRPEIILLDVNLKSNDGRMISEDLKKTLPFSVKIILISGDPRTLIEYQHHYADGILNKPFEFAELENKLKQQLKRR